MVVQVKVYADENVLFTQLFTWILSFCKVSPDPWIVVFCPIEIWIKFYKFASNEIILLLS